MKHHRSLRYAEKLEAEPIEQQDYFSKLDIYSAGIAAMAEPDMSPGDAIMHFFWTIADNTEDSPDALLHEHMRMHGFASQNAFMALLTPLVGQHITLLRGRNILASKD